MRNVAKKGILTAVATGSVLASTAGYAYAADAQGTTTGSSGVVSGNQVQAPLEVPINVCGNTVDVIGLLNTSHGNSCAGVNGHSGTGGSGTGSSASGSSGTASSGDSGTANGSSASGASASGVAADSPGVASGNSIQAPAHVPVNVCGNSVNVVGLGNVPVGDACGNVAPPAPSTRPTDDCPEDNHTSVPPSTSPSTPPSTPPRTNGEPTTVGGRTSDPTTGTTPTASTPAARASDNGGPSSHAVPASTRSGSAATDAAGGQLASTGAGDVEMLGAAGLALLLGGGVLYRRARAGAR
ncbi:chaplin [Streptomyces kaniharaensis]|uniref:Chaplin n=1 Tax=Streptomyces kaniharaensis TaxID=212423 RepID=A0A6N7KM76_9ACTN|nr:chaplin [Streptomyces kaniharaensis]MQS11548.1 chaplin [Streptomyces kaniharaensis]